jgi:hypothetical protein
MREMAERYHTVLVVGGEGEKCRVVAEGYGFKDFQVELFAEIEASLFLRLSATVGQENIRARIFLLESVSILCCYSIFPLTWAHRPGEG